MQCTQKNILHKKMLIVRIDKIWCPSFKLMFDIKKHEIIKIRKDCFQT